MSPIPLAGRCALPLLLALAGCSLVGGEPAEVDVTVYLRSEAAQALDVTAVLGGRQVRDFDTSIEGDLVAGPFETDSGASTLGGRVAASGASTAAAVDVDVQPGWRYALTCAVGAQNPAFGCFGCSDVAAVVLDPALGLPPTDSLFVVLSGGDPDNPVLY